MYKIFIYFIQFDSLSILLLMPAACGNQKNRENSIDIFILTLECGIFYQPTKPYICSYVHT